MGKSVTATRKSRSRTAAAASGPSPSDANNAPVPASPSTSTALRARNPSLSTKIAQMRLTLAPIYPIHIPAGAPHSSFPKTVLQYWLLTEEEIDAFAAYYQQIGPSATSHLYPACMNWDPEFLKRRCEVGPEGCVVPPPALDVVMGGTEEGGVPATVGGLFAVEGAPEVSLVEMQRRAARGELNAVERLAVKRRMVGKFIGLRGCETPLWEMRAKVRWLDGRVRREVEEERQRETVYRRGRKWV